jgi:hypothetical protein
MNSGRAPTNDTIFIADDPRGTISSRHPIAQREPDRILSAHPVGQNLQLETHMRSHRGQDFRFGRPEGPTIENRRVLDNPTSEQDPSDQHLGHGLVPVVPE